jgi:fused signal recognition particle receptor
MFFLILAIVVVLFGLGVVVVNRRRERRLSLERARPPAKPVAKPPPEVLEPDTAAPELGEPEVEEAEELEEVEAVDEVGELEELAPPRFRDRLGKARAALAGAFASVRARGGITDDTWDDLEEALLRADVGVSLTTELIDELRGQVKTNGLTTPDEVLDALKADLLEHLEGVDRTLTLDGKSGEPCVWLFVGVNGVGKTTTIGKVGARQVADGHSVVMAAGDTFRAAAAEQLELWANRVGADLVRGAEGGDPSSVIFDGVQRAAARGADLVLADTAGRLHTKVNLMEELRKVRRVADRPPGHVSEVLLVIDATTGQNGLTQARQFTEAVEVTGVVLTKLDGSAKGGIVLAIQKDLGLPVKLVGLGETSADLVDFDAREFIDALFE